MNFRDIPGFVNIVGVTLMLIFYVPWRGRGRPPLNKMIDNIGFVSVLAAATQASAVVQRPLVMLELGSLKYIIAI